jgi:hypothetical protein
MCPWNTFFDTDPVASMKALIALRLSYDMDTTEHFSRTLPTYWEPSVIKTTILWMLDRLIEDGKYRKQDES